MSQLAVETVGNFPNLASAKVSQSVLQARGIASLIPDEYLAGVDWQLITALQGIRLQVAPEDVEQATWLLAQTSPASDSSAEDDGEDDTEDGEEGLELAACPRCGSTLVGPPAWKRRLKAASFLFPALVFLWPVFALAVGNRTCFACGKTWDHEAPPVEDPP